MIAGRRCALPGCYVVIEPATDGQPQRKYCTAAHRAVARQLRRGGTNRSASAPPLMLQELPLPPLASELESSPVRRRRRFADATGRRARAMAVLGSAGLLVTGGALALSGSSTGTSSEVPSAAPWLAPDPEAEQHWVSDARVSLASLDQQLAEVSAAEQEWNSLSPQVRGAQIPDGVRALSQRKALLQQQRTALAGELASYQSFHQTKRDLAETEWHVADLDRTLAEKPRDRQHSAAEADTVQRLKEERAAHAHQCELQRQKLEALRDSVRDAMAMPLPSSDHATKSITSSVRELVKNPTLRQLSDLYSGATAQASGAGTSPTDLGDRGRQTPDNAVNPPSAAVTAPSPDTAVVKPPSAAVTAPTPGTAVKPVPDVAAAGPASAHRPAPGLLDSVTKLRSGGVTRAARPGQARPRSAQSPGPSGSPHGGFDGSGDNQARSAYDAADAAISALPFGEGVKKMARSAASDEIRSRLRRGQRPDSTSSHAKKGSSFAYRFDSSRSAYLGTSSNWSSVKTGHRTSHKAGRSHGDTPSGSSSSSSNRLRSSAPTSMQRILSRYASGYSSHTSSRRHYRFGSNHHSSSSSRYRSSRSSHSFASHFFGGH
ncbi:MAG: hypothetical protein H0V92_07825 [Pseudonocardiales bacterium]|nr:hypothetical protein [Pseudonocardiales bacterium]